MTFQARLFIEIPSVYGTYSCPSATQRGIPTAWNVTFSSHMAGPRVFLGVRRVETGHRVDRDWERMPLFEGLLLASAFVGPQCQSGRRPTVVSLSVLS